MPQSAHSPAHSDLHQRAAIATAAADGMEHANFGARRALVGFDGFIDFIMDLVDVRTDMGPRGFRRIPTIGSLATRVGAAAGKSTNIEVVTHERRWGGNGPLLAGGVARLGMPTTYIGAIGREDDHRALNPAFAPFASLCEGVVPIAAPGRTDAFEFDDGKLMLNHCSAVQDVTWERIVEVVGLDALRGIVAGAELIGIVNWSLIGGVNGIWRGLMEHVLPALATRPRIFIDLSDPAKRTDDDLRDGLALLAELNTLAPVTLGLNLAESERIERLCIPMESRATPTAVASQDTDLGRRLIHVSSALRHALRLDCVVIHPREGAAASTASGDSAWFDGPLTRTPKLSTGAGDHFNAGFAAAQVAGLPLEQCLACGTALSGAYVRDGIGPDLGRLCEFLRELPAPEHS